VSLESAITAPLLRGDLVEVRARRAELDKFLLASPDALDLNNVVDSSLEILEESGDVAAMVPLAEDYRRRKRGFAGDAAWLEASALAVLRRAGRVSQAEVQAARDAWRKSMAEVDLVPNARWRTWVWTFAVPARTPDEAREALEEATDFSPVPVTLETSETATLAVGRVYLLAGRLDEAIPALRRAAALCFAPSEIIAHIRANELLGEALEATHDKEGACRAWGEVLSRWPAPKPRSITVDAAREGMKRLGCAR
jgi:tetratricopeptide (TPR) repeat protein